MRGFGPTRFRDGRTRRGGQFTALAQDVEDFADALGLGRFTLVGHDPGGRREALTGVGHFPQRERPEAVIKVITGRRRRGVVHHALFFLSRLSLEASSNKTSSNKTGRDKSRPYT